MSKLFSIICVTLNAGNHIAGLLKSIEVQKFKDYEVIIVDGGSTDNTLSIAKQFPNIKLICEKDRGIYDAMNKGIKAASGDWLIFMGGDDKFCSSQVLEIIKDNTDENTDLVYGNVLMGKNADIIYHPKFSKKIYFLNTIHHQGVFYNKRVFDNFLYEQKYRVSADYELNLKLYIEKAHAKYCNCIISVIGEYGVSSKVLKIGYSEEISIRNKIVVNKQLRFLLNRLSNLRYQIKRYSPIFLKHSHFAHRFKI